MNNKNAIVDYINKPFNFDTKEFEKLNWSTKMVLSGNSENFHGGKFADLEFCYKKANGEDNRIEHKKVSFVIKHLKNNGFPKELYNCVDSIHDIFMNSFNVHLTDEQYDLFEFILDKADGINVAVKEKDKSFVILDFYGNKKALCAWRNNKDCKIGITFLCPCDLKAKKPFIFYKGKKIYIGNSNGWVF